MSNFFNEKPPEDTEGMKLAKQYIESLELTPGEMSRLGGFLMGQSIKRGILDALSDEPPT